jgi:hypothetical protein
MPTLKGWLFVASLLLGLAVASADAYRQYVSSRMPLSREALRAHPTSMSRVYIVAAGDLPMPFDVELVAHYERTLGLPVERLSPVPIDPSLVNTPRRQLMGDATAAWVAQRHPHPAADPRAVIITITAMDLSGEQFGWNFAFSVRSGERYAVVSAARMNPALYGPADPDLWRARLRKMVSKNIGLLYYRFLPAFIDHQSLLYMRVGGVDDLDRMGEHFMTTDAWSARERT